MFGTPIKDIMKNNTTKRFELVNLGASGSGKTTRSLTATQFGPAYLLDFDGKIQGAARNIPVSLKDQVDLDKLSVKNCRGMDYGEVYKHILELQGAFSGQEVPFATIIIDTFTNLSDIIYKSIFPTEDKLFVSNVMQLWGKVSHRTSTIFSALQALPCNIIVNCHTREDENGIPMGPDGKGGFRNDIKARVTDMHYIAFQNGKNLVRVRNSNKPPVNTNIDSKWIDANGYAKEFGLKVLEDYAFKVGADNAKAGA